MLKRMFENILNIRLDTQTGVMNLGIPYNSSPWHSIWEILEHLYIGQSVIKRFREGWRVVVQLIWLNKKNYF